MGPRERGYEMLTLASLLYSAGCIPAPPYIPCFSSRLVGPIAAALSCQGLSHNIPDLFGARRMMAPTIVTALAAILSVSSAPLAAAAPGSLPLFSRQTAGNCTSSSFTVPSWYIREFKTTSATEAAFSLQNRATGLSAALSCKSGASVGAWACTASGPISDFPLQVAVQVKDGKASVEVQQSWSCNDRDPARP